jgi:tetratricopeptide (TPR) repeat protein
MKHLLLSAVVALTCIVASPASLAEKPNIEANKIAREAGEAAKSQDWDTAIEGFKKAADMDRKYAGNLAAALQQRASAATKQNRFSDAVADLSDAIKAHATTGAYESRAYVYMRMNDIDHAQADYTEAIKTNPNDARLYSHRAHMLASKGDFKGTIGDCDKILKMKKGDKEAQELKAWAEARIKAKAEQAQSPAPAPPPPR